jgi:hypothetical protein
LSMHRAKLNLEKMHGAKSTANRSANRTRIQQPVPPPQEPISVVEFGDRSHVGRLCPLKKQPDETNAPAFAGPLLPKR